MKDLAIGVHVLEPTAPALVDAILRAEELGLDGAWMTLGFPRPDPIPVFAAAAMRAQRIKFGTSIVPSFPRHPLALAQEARPLAELAPGRFRLGVGPSHKGTIEGTYGIPYRKPLSHLREYLQLLKLVLQQGGKVEFRGEHFRFQGDAGRPVDIQVMASGLRAASFEMIGEVADGAISWMCPRSYIEQVALPALEAGATRAGRQRPAMIVHVPICVDEDLAQVRAAARHQLGRYPTLPSYQQMFINAGYPEAAEGVLSDRMIDEIVIHGDETKVAEELRKFASIGIDEILCAVITASPDPQASRERGLTLLGTLSREA